VTVDKDQLEQFLGRFAADSAAAAHSATVVLGHRLGLFKALAAGGPHTADQLAAATGCHPRLVAEWLNAQVASDYCVHDPTAGTYRLTPEQVACLADESSPTFVAGNALAANVLHRDEPLVRKAFTGDGRIGWHEHHPDLFTAAERACRGLYETRLVAEWVPSLDGVAERLHLGGRLADVGCGFGSSTIQLAKAFPHAAVSGFDYHRPSIEAARSAAAAAGVSDRVTFEVASGDSFGGADYDLVCMFNAFHEMGDPTSVAAHVRSVLAVNGSFMISEPYAGDRVEDNRTPIGRTFYSMSTMVCLPNALSQGATQALGAQAGTARLRQVITDAGFTRFRQVAAAPPSLVLEAKP
jgi:2-polyprenyl-3-methyl-5-hydroxy-6-metoxy-1,4-benzoquinol methylase